MSIGSKLYRKQSTDNSMAWAKEHIHEAPDGAVFLADQLTKASGRQGRTWSIYPGQLLVTFVLKPPQLHTFIKEDLPIKLNQLTMALSLGVLDAIKAYGQIGLKWPNDFIAEQKKLGGIIIHVVWEGSTPIGIIVGFALNVNNEFAATDPLAATATSLATIVGKELNRRLLYKDLLEHLNQWYNVWKAGDFMRIYKTWKKEQVFLGKSIRIHQKDGTVVDGVASQVMPNGDLMLSTGGKKQQTIPFYQVEEVTVGK